MEEKVNYLLHGLEHNLFPCNFSDTKRRQPWGIGYSVLPDTELNPDLFAFNQDLQKDINRVIELAKSFPDDYKDQEQIEPQLILNYLQGYVLNIECYDLDGRSLPSLHLLSDDDARNFIISVGANKFYDMLGEPPVYER